MAGTNNSCNYSPVQYDSITGGSNGAINNVTPSSTSGVPFISQGSSSQPTFGTAVVAGGGTGVTTMTTAYAPVCSGTTATGALQVASSGLSNSGYVLTSTGSSSLPTWQAASSGGITTIDSDSGSVTGSTITIYADQAASKAGETVSFTASGTTITFNVSDSAYNTAIGYDAGNSGFSGEGGYNTFLGYKAGYDGSTAVYNTCIGANAGAGGLTAGYNTIIGADAGLNGTSGTDNVFIGSYVASNSSTSGNYNVVIGTSAAEPLTSGHNNTIIGQNAGSAIQTGYDNIYIGYGAGGSDGSSINSNILIGNVGMDESNTIIIGTQGSSTGQQNQCLIAGIYGATASSGVEVYCASGGQLGTSTSALRFKKDIEDLDPDISSKIHDLRPVKFKYKIDNDTVQYGLIAEEVLDIFPEIIRYDREGNIETIAYRYLPILMLKEIQKLRIELNELKAKK